MAFFLHLILNLDSRMDLSVVIVNYNVRYFLSQCLFAVSEAKKGIECEVFVVDNNSVDGSCAMVREKYPWVKLIENKENLGFSKANNQAMKQATGRYILLLNPDTVVEEDTFRKCLSFMDSHPEAGGLGVKMIDGKGRFLPESKRSLPTPLVAFYKIFGLSSLFPKSRIFGRYHLGYLDKENTHQVEILSGAYMFLREEALDKTGFLDETFFMYGEDIDLSWRIVKSGYINYYFPETTIIHYKGESTRKGSINYVLVFYQAMIIFAGKHFSRNNARLFSVLINLAIYFRALVAIARRFIQKIYQPLIDGLLMYAGFWFLSPVWESLRFGVDEYYPDEFYTFLLPSYIMVMLLSLYYSGGYERPVKLWNLLKGHLTGTLLILVFYALLPESLRFSRAIVLLGSIWCLLVLFFHRLIMNVTRLRDYEFADNRRKRLLIVGNSEEAKRVSYILENTRIRPEIIGFVYPGKTIPDSEFLGHLDQLPEIIKIHKADEIVFCSGNVSSAEIIRQMGLLASMPVDFKIAPPESQSIIGSNSINTAGDLYLIEFNSIGKESNRRHKRLFDVIASLLLIFLSPMLAFFIPRYLRILGSAIKVLTARATWIGYCPASDISMLPLIRKGIFHPCGSDSITAGFSEKMNAEYARDYKVSDDLNLLWKSLLGKRE